MLCLAAEAPRDCLLPTSQNLCSPGQLQLHAYETFVLFLHWTYITYIVVIGAVTVFWVQIGASSLGEASPSSVEKMERSDRGKDCPLHRYLPVLMLDAHWQEL